MENEGHSQQRAAQIDNLDMAFEEGLKWYIGLKRGGSWQPIRDRLEG